MNPNSGNSGSAQPEPLPGGFVPPAPPAGQTFVVDRATLESLVDSRMNSIARDVAQAAAREAMGSMEQKVGQAEASVKRAEDSIRAADARYKDVHNKAKEVEDTASEIRKKTAEINETFSKTDEHTRKVVAETLKAMPKEDEKPRTIGDMLVQGGIIAGSIAGGMSLGFLVKKIFIKTPSALPVLPPV